MNQNQYMEADDKSTSESVKPTKAPFGYYKGGRHP